MIHRLSWTERPPAFAAVLLLLATAAAPAAAETIHLRGGNIITGEVLTRKAEFTAVDLGYTILQVPNKQIARIEEERPEAEQDGSPLQRPDEDRLYRQARLERRPVKELVKKFGQGIVLVRTPAGVGSGFIIDPRGYFITNAHVIQGETNISATLFARKGEEFSRRKADEVEIVAVNPFMDLALLKLKPPEDVELVPLNFGDMDRVRAGDPVVAIGNPLGFERTVSEGIVSTKARAARGIVLIQTTAPINPGNSGGPLLNMRGEVIGVTNMKIGFIAEGMGFAIPINFVKDFLEFRKAYAYDKDNPNTGHRYLPPPGKPEEEQGE